MKQIIFISEECHGTIGAASTFEKAKQFLLDTAWINEYCNLWNPKTGEWDTPPGIFGENWQEKILEQNEEFFDGAFYFCEKEYLE